MTSQGVIYIFALTTLMDDLYYFINPIIKPLSLEIIQQILQISIWIHIFIGVVGNLVTEHI